jgi:hypothetical protein
MITIGIDPGWATFAIAINKDGLIIHKESFSPKSFVRRDYFITELGKRFTFIDDKEVINVYIERFVAYAGVQSSASEDIIMLIGALDYYFAVNYSKPILVKAIDWKIKICQHLVKTKEFSNPRKNLDKKFSLTAAELLCGEKVTSDHEADAICLSYLTTDILQGRKNGDT